MSANPEIVFERAFYIGNIFGGICYGIQICITFLSIYFLMNSKNTPKRDVAYYVAYGVVMLVCIAFAMSANAVYGQMMWIEHRDFPGGPVAYFGSNAAWWYNVAGTAFDAFADFLGDALLLYRCYIIWGCRLIVIVVPGIMLVASLVLSIIATVESALPGSSFFASQSISFIVPWISLTTTLNFLLTGLIAGRLIWFRYSTRHHLNKESSAIYTSVVAILIESAAPFTVLGCAFAILLGINNQADIFFICVWGYYVGIAPMLIILRMSMGRSWTKNTFTETNVEFAVPTTIETRLSRTTAFGSNNPEKTLDHSRESLNAKDGASA